MKTMIQYLSGAVVLASAQVTFAACPADGSAGKCCKATAKATTVVDKSACEKSACKDQSKCADAKVADGQKRVRYIVKGMTCGGCSKAITKSLEKVEGVAVREVSHKSGCAEVDYDPAKVNKSDIAAAISHGKFAVTAERITVSVKGMTCSKCSDKVTAALNAIEGVTVKNVCSKSGKAVVDVDTGKSNRAAVVKAITATGFKAG